MNQHDANKNQLQQLTLKHVKEMQGAWKSASSYSL
jgi:hypothetical protein